MQINLAVLAVFHFRMLSFMKKMENPEKRENNIAPRKCNQ